MRTTTTPRALREYRALDAAGRADYDPAGKAGATDVRRLQAVARAVGTLREARHQSRANPQYPAWRLDAARRDLLSLSGRGLNRRHGALVRDAVTAYHVLPLGPEDAGISDAAARTAHPRRKNWVDVEGRLGACAAGEVIEHDIAYRGKFKGWHGSEYAPTMRALARISQDGAILTALIGHAAGGGRPEAAYTVQAGRGYRWDADANGVRLVRLADGADYHPSTDEVRAGRAVIVTTLRERAAVRKAATRAAKREANILKQAARGGVYICLADSVRAGNCRAGTESWARRHGLDVRRHYRADALPAAATPDESRRIALVVLSATRRQATEMARGFCEV